jgi:hypothetical protein
MDGQTEIMIIDWWLDLSWNERYKIYKKHHKVKRMRK